MLDIPRHIRRLRIVNVEQIAMVMAGLREFASVEAARKGKSQGWREAETYKETLIQAMKLNEIKPLRVFLFEDDPFINSIVGDVDEISLDSNIVDADFLAKDAWEWARKELLAWSETSPIHITDNDPLAELNSYKAEFVSVQEMFDIFKSKYPHMDVKQIAEWMVKKLCYENKPQIYTQGIAGKLYEHGNDYYGDDNPFLFHLLNKVINAGEEAFLTQPSSNTAEPPLDFDDDIPF